MARERKEIAESDWAYLAGFIDADGNIGTNPWKRKIDGEPRYGIRLSITNSDRNIINWLVTNFGGSVFLTNKNSPRHHRSTWRWTVTGKSAEPIMRHTIPYLKVKGKHAELGLQFITTLGLSNRVSKENIELRSYIAAQLKRMNQRGRSR